VERGGGSAPRRNRRRWQGWGAAAAVAPYIGAAAAIPHGVRILPSWSTAGAALTVVAHDGRLPGPRSPQRTVGAPLAAVAHVGWLPDLLKFQMVV
jgi:hypothetical protein